MVTETPHQVPGFFIPKPQKIMKQKPDLIIAIDPDVDHSGVAVLSVATRRIKTSSMSFPDLMDYLQSCWNTEVNEGKSLKIVVEAGWLNQSHWHLTARDTARLAAAKGNAAGRNHEVGRKIVEMARHYGLDVDEVKPLRKCWRGRDGKITHEELSQFVPGLPARTSQDIRDACLLAWTYAGFPIRITPKTTSL